MTGNAKESLRFLQALPVPVFVVANHRFIFSNDAQTKILGASDPAEVLGARVDGFLAFDSRERFLRFLDELAAHVGTTQTLAEKWLRLDGRSLTIEYVLKSIPYEGGAAIEGVLRKVIVAEPKERKTEEVEAPAPTPTVPAPPQPLSDIAREALEGLTDGVYWVDDSGVCRFINRSGAEMLGYDAEELIGKKIHELVHYRGESGELRAADECSLHAGSDVQQETTDTMWRWDGSPLRVQATSSPLASGGRVISFRAASEIPAKEEPDIEQLVSEARGDERAAAAELLRQTVNREKAVAEERLKKAVEEERRQTQKAIEEAVANERREVDSRIEQALARERGAQKEAIASAVASERVAGKKAVRDAVAAERSATESAVRDAARIATEKAGKDSATAARSAIEKEQKSARAAIEQEQKSALETQRAEAERVLAEAVAKERAAAQKSVEQAVQQERGRAERTTAEAVEGALAEERKRADTAIAAAVERALAEERSRAQTAARSGVDAEKTRSESVIEEARREAARQVEQIRAESARALEGARREAAQTLEKVNAAVAEQFDGAVGVERRAAQEALTKAITAERAKHESAVRQMSEEARSAATLVAQKAVEAERASAAKMVEEAVAAARAKWQPQQAAKPAPANAALELLLDSMAQGVYALDMQGRITHINRAAAEMLEYEPAKLLGKSAHETIHHKRRDGSPYPLIECPLHSGISLGHVTSGENEMFWTRKGASFPIDYSYAPVHQGSNVGGGVVTFKDITDRKLVGQEMAQVDRMSSLGRFAAAATHEFDKILQGIQAAAEVIRWHSSGEELENAKAHLGRLLERGSHLTRQISRFTEPKESTEAKVIEVIEWFQSFLQAARVALKENIELNFRLPDELLYVVAEPGQLNQIFMNLALNGRDAMPNGGRLTLSIDSCLSGSTYSFGVIPTPDRFIHFVVEDTGVGIPPELMSRIFEPLFTTKGSGTAGMGLAICHQLVRKLGGSVFVESTVGAGTQFHIFLPATHPELEAGEEKSQPKPSAEPVAKPEGRKRIVVIGTERIPETELKSAAAAGVDVELVYGGQEATASIERDPPDALVMEISWMEADGVEMYRNIANRWPKLPIIVSTANIHEVKIKGGALSLPNVRYLPYDVPTLLKWVEGSRGSTV